MIGRVVAAVSLLATGCPPSPSPPDTGSDAGQPPSDAAVRDVCYAAEQTLVALGCKDSRGDKLAGPNFHGAMWGETCRYNAANGVDMKPSCIGAAKNCAEVRKCR